MRDDGLWRSSVATNCRPYRLPIDLVVVMKSAKFTISILILLIFIGLVEYFFGWLALIRPWLDIPIKTIALTITLTFFSYYLRALRLYDYFRKEMTNGLLLGFKLMLQHNLLNNLLPMRSGEISFPMLMNRYFKVPAVQSVPALLWFRIMDLHTIVLLGLIAIGQYWFSLSITLLLTFLWLTVPLLIYKGHHALQSSLSPEHSGKFQALAHRMLTSLPQTPRNFWHSWFWTLINWVVKIAVFAWVLQIFVEIPIAAAWIGAISGDLTSVLPIHGFAGVGTYEAGVVAGTALLTIPVKTVLPAAINLHLFILASTLIGGAISLLIPDSR